MHPKTPPGSPAQNLPRIGIPYRRSREQVEGRQEKIQPYVAAVEQAGAAARLISLFLSPEELRREIEHLDGLVLPGSSADVAPARYGETPSPQTAESDPDKERTDLALLEWAFAAKRPTLCICYGTQLLNVFLGGTLVQDIATEIRSPFVHQWQRERGLPEPHHPARFVAGSQVERLAGVPEAVVNSSHHQSIRRPGLGLRVTANSPDGVIEAVESVDAEHWLIGVQWHPERQRNEHAEESLAGAHLARALFLDLVRSARTTPGASLAENQDTVSFISNDAEVR